MATKAKVELAALDIREHTVEGLLSEHSQLNTDYETPSQRKLSSADTKVAELQQERVDLWNDLKTAKPEERAAKLEQVKERDNEILDQINKLKKDRVELEEEFEQKNVVELQDYNAARRDVLADMAEKAAKNEFIPKVDSPEFTAAVEKRAVEIRAERESLPEGQAFAGHNNENATHARIKKSLVDIKKNDVNARIEIKENIEIQNRYRDALAIEDPAARRAAIKEADQFHDATRLKQAERLIAHVEAKIRDLGPRERSQLLFTPEDAVELAEARLTQAKTQLRIDSLKSGGWERGVRDFHALSDAKVRQLTEAVVNARKVVEFTRLENEKGVRNSKIESIHDRMDVLSDPAALIEISEKLQERLDANIEALKTATDVVERQKLLSDNQRIADAVTGLNGRFENINKTDLNGKKLGETLESIRAKDFDEMVSELSKGQEQPKGKEISAADVKASLNELRAELQKERTIQEGKDGKGGLQNDAREKLAQSNRKKAAEELSKRADLPDAEKMDAFLKSLEDRLELNAKKLAETRDPVEINRLRDQNERIQDTLDEMRVRLHERGNGKEARPDGLKKILADYEARLQIRDGKKTALDATIEILAAEKAKGELAALREEHDVQRKMSLMLPDAARVDAVLDALNSRLANVQKRMAEASGHERVALVVEQGKIEKTLGELQRRLAEPLRFTEAIDHFLSNGIERTIDRLSHENRTDVLKEDRDVSERLNDNLKTTDAIREEFHARLNRLPDITKTERILRTLEERFEKNLKKLTEARDPKVIAELRATQNEIRQAIREMRDRLADVHGKRAGDFLETVEKGTEHLAARGKTVENEVLSNIARQGHERSRDLELRNAQERAARIQSQLESLEERMAERVSDLRDELVLVRAELKIITAEQGLLEATNRFTQIAARFAVKRAYANWRKALSSQVESLIAKNASAKTIKLLGKTDLGRLSEKDALQLVDSLEKDLSAIMKERGGFKYRNADQKKAILAIFTDKSINLETGGGKSLVAALFASALRGQVIYIAPEAPLATKLITGDSVNGAALIDVMERISTKYHGTPKRIYNLEEEYHKAYSKGGGVESELAKAKIRTALKDEHAILVMSRQTHGFLYLNSRTDALLREAWHHLEGKGIPIRLLADEVDSLATPMNFVMSHASNQTLQANSVEWRKAEALHNFLSKQDNHTQLKLEAGRELAGFRAKDMSGEVGWHFDRHSNHAWVTDALMDRIQSYGEEKGLTLSSQDVVSYLNGRGQAEWGSKNQATGAAVENVDGRLKVIPVDENSRPQYTMTHNDKVYAASIALHYGESHKGIGKLWEMVSVSDTRMQVAESQALNRYTSIQGMTGTAEGARILLKNKIDFDVTMISSAKDRVLSSFEVVRRAETEELAKAQSEARLDRIVTKVIEPFLNKPSESMEGQGLRRALGVGLSKSERDYVMQRLAERGISAKVVSPNDLVDDKMRPYLTGEKYYDEFGAHRGTQPRPPQVLILDSSTGLVGINYQGEHVLFGDVTDLRTSKYGQAMNRVGRAFTDFFSRKGTNHTAEWHVWVREEKAAAILDRVGQSRFQQEFLRDKQWNGGYEFYHSKRDSVHMDQHTLLPLDREYVDVEGHLGKIGARYQELSMEHIKTLWDKGERFAPERLDVNGKQQIVDPNAGIRELLVRHVKGMAQVDGVLVDLRVALDKYVKSGIQTLSKHEVAALTQNYLETINATAGLKAEAREGFVRTMKLQELQTRYETALARENILKQYVAKNDNAFTRNELKKAIAYREAVEKAIQGAANPQGKEASYKPEDSPESAWKAMEKQFESERASSLEVWRELKKASVYSEETKAINDMINRLEKASSKQVAEQKDMTSKDVNTIADALSYAKQLAREMLPMESQPAKLVTEAQRYMNKLINEAGGRDKGPTDTDGPGGGPSNRPHTPTLSGEGSGLDLRGIPIDAPASQDERIPTAVASMIPNLELTRPAAPSAPMATPTVAKTISDTKLSTLRDMARQAVAQAGLDLAPTNLIAIAAAPTLADVRELVELEMGRSMPAPSGWSSDPVRGYVEAINPWGQGSVGRAFDAMHDKQRDNFEKAFDRTFKEVVWQDTWGTVAVGIKAWYQNVRSSRAPKAETRTLYLAQAAAANPNAVVQRLLTTELLNGKRNDSLTALNARTVKDAAKDNPNVLHPYRTVAVSIPPTDVYIGDGYQTSRQQKNGVTQFIIEIVPTDEHPVSGTALARALQLINDLGLPSQDAAEVVIRLNDAALTDSRADEIRQAAAEANAAGAVIYVQNGQDTMLRNGTNIEKPLAPMPSMRWARAKEILSLKWGSRTAELFQLDETIQHITKKPDLSKTKDIQEKRRLMQKHQEELTLLLQSLPYSSKAIRRGINAGLKIEVTNRKPLMTLLQTLSDLNLPLEKVREAVELYMKQARAAKRVQDAALEEDAIPALPETTVSVVSHLFSWAREKDIPMHKDPETGINEITDAAIEQALNNRTITYSDVQGLFILIPPQEKISPKLKIILEKYAPTGAIPGQPELLITPKILSSLGSQVLIGAIGKSKPILLVPDHWVNYKTHLTEGMKPYLVMGAPAITQRIMTMSEYKVMQEQQAVDAQKKADERQARLDETAESESAPLDLLPASMRAREGFIKTPRELIGPATTLLSVGMSVSALLAGVSGFALILGGVSLLSTAWNMYSNYRRTGQPFSFTGWQAAASGTGVFVFVYAVSAFSGIPLTQFVDPQYLPTLVGLFMSGSGLVKFAGDAQQFSEKRSSSVSVPPLRSTIDWTVPRRWATTALSVGGVMVLTNSASWGADTTQSLTHAISNVSPWFYTGLTALLGVIAATRVPMTQDGRTFAAMLANA